MRPEDITRRSDATTHDALSDLMFLTDVRGHIRCWSSLRPWPGQLPDPTGRQVRELLPALPIRAETPGYNVAFVRMAFRQPHGQAYDLRLADGALHPVQLDLKAVSLERGYCLAGLIRPGAAAASALAAATRPAPTNPPIRRPAHLPAPSPVLLPPYQPDRRRSPGAVPAMLLVDFARAQNERRAETLTTFAA